MVAHQDRWSRDNKKSQPGLDWFKENNIGFYVLEKREDIFSETSRLYLGLPAVIGEYHAQRQTRSTERTARLRHFCHGTAHLTRLPLNINFHSRNHKSLISSLLLPLL
jgi:hypothetical protein